MHKFPIVIPEDGYPADPDRFHESMQPFADGSQSVDEHDLEGGGFDNTDGVLAELIAAGGQGQTFDPGIEHLVSNWDVSLGDAQEHVPGMGWSVIRSTETSVTTEGGILLVTGMVQWGKDRGDNDAFPPRVGIAILIDGVAYLHTMPPALQGLDRYSNAGIFQIPGHSGFAEAQAIEAWAEVDAGTHSISLAIQVVGYAPAYTFNCQLAHVEFRH